jgi:hypothetical protein
MMLLLEAAKLRDKHVHIPGIKYCSKLVGQMAAAVDYEREMRLLTP